MRSAPRIVIALAVACGLALGARASAAPLRGGTVSADYPGAAVALVTVHAAGHKLLFIVDSGSSTSAITTKAAAEIGLPGDGPTQTSQTIGCTTTSHTATLSGWRLGKIALPAVTVGLLGNSLSKEKIHGTPVAGLLGSDVLARFGSATFDLAGDTLTLGGRVRHARAGIPMQVARSHGAVAELVRGRIGPLSIPFVLDTGSPLTVLPQSAARRLHLTTLGSIPVGGAAGCKVKAKLTAIPVWSAGGTPLPTSPALAISQRLKLSPHGPAFGLIGANTLFGYGRMTLDFTDGRLLLGRPS